MTTWTCDVCGEPADSGSGAVRGLCTRCTKRKQRHQPPSAERATVPPGQGVQLNLRLHRADLALVDELVKARAVPETTRSAFIRRAVQLRALEQLDRSPHTAAAPSRRRR